MCIAHKYWNVMALLGTIREPMPMALWFRASTCGLSHKYRMTKMAPSSILFYLLLVGDFLFFPLPYLMLEVFASCACFLLLLFSSHTPPVPCLLHEKWPVPSPIAFTLRSCASKVTASGVTLAAVCWMCCTLAVTRGSRRACVGRQADATGCMCVQYMSLEAGWVTESKHCRMCVGHWACV